MSGSCTLNNCSFSESGCSSYSRTSGYNDIISMI